jgi:predicted nucleic acid-binding protein
VITLIDSSLWVDFTRARSPRRLRQFIAPHVLDPAAHLSEPVMYELLRNAVPEEIGRLRQQLEIIPMLATPGNLWERATALGQSCRKKGGTPGALDLLIATVALAHHAVLVTLDEDFQIMAEASNLEVKLLQRPTG